MPRNPRLVCAGCDKAIDGSGSLRCSTDLFRLFISIRCFKKVEPGDASCQLCRYKFGNWLRKVKGDFDQVIDRISSENGEVSMKLDTIWLQLM